MFLPSAGCPEVAKLRSQNAELRGEIERLSASSPDKDALVACDCALLFYGTESRILINEIAQNWIPLI